jgi:hypothetical protein
LLILVILHEVEPSQMQSVVSGVLVVPALVLQHLMPASACWANSNSSAAKATTATANIENNFANDRLLGNW